MGTTGIDLSTYYITQNIYFFLFFFLFLKKVPVVPVNHYRPQNKGSRNGQAACPLPTRCARQEYSERLKGQAASGGRQYHAATTS
jgi:hypothetical protein